MKSRKVTLVTLSWNALRVVACSNVIVASRRHRHHPRCWNPWCQEVIAGVEEDVGECRRDLVEDVVFPEHAWVMPSAKAEECIGD